jgi:hypothetical protein
MTAFGRFSVSIPCQFRGYLFVTVHAPDGGPTLFRALWVDSATTLRFARNDGSCASLRAV